MYKLFYGGEMNFKSVNIVSFASAAAFCFMLVACGSDSSSAPQDDPEPTSSQENSTQEDSPASSSDVADSLSSSSANPLSSATAKSSSSKKSVSSSDESGGNEPSGNEPDSGTSSSSTECFKEGMANITMRSMENTNIACPNAMTVYDYDRQIFYKCEGSTLVETQMAPCGSGQSESSSSAVVVSNVEYGTLQDPRDGKSYKTVVIGGKTWMAENLNFSKSSDGSISLDSTFCLDDDPANCDKYGRFYQEFDAEDACPEGWAIPQASDWRDLSNAVKEQLGDNNGSLRAVGEWEDTIFGDNVTATNASGFSALPAGYRASTGQYDGEGTKAYFWGEDNMNHYAWILSNQYDLDKESLIRGYFAYSIRCIKN